MRGKRRPFCPMCSEVTDAESWRLLFLIGRALALRLSNEQAALFGEVGGLFHAAGKLRPHKQFRIRSYMIGVILVAWLLAVPAQEITPTVILSLPALAAAGQRWLWWHGYPRLASGLVGVYVFEVFMVNQSPGVLDLVAGLSPSATTVLGAVWASALLYVASGLTRRWGRADTHQAEEHAAHLRR